MMMSETRMSEELDDEKPARGRLRRLASYVARLLFIIIAAGLLAFGGGFLVFYQHVATMPVPDAPQADGIVALTGGYQRIDQAVLLLGKGAGKRLLISGVNPATTGNHIRLLTRSTTNLFTCCVDIGHDAVDTTGNAVETARWIDQQGFASVILVTNNYHMPRSLVELEHASPSTTFIPYPVMTPLDLSAIAANPLVLRTLASEYVKFLAVHIRNWWDHPA
ncbi:uncharacterized SAM-binding protein YcdF (DUF218 family) [Rhizobium alvei]